MHGSDSLPGRKQRCGRYWYTVLEHCGAADADDAGESTCPSGFRLLAPNLYGGCSSPAIYHIVQGPPEIGVDDVLIEESMGRSGWRRDIKIGGREGGREGGRALWAHYAYRTRPAKVPLYLSAVLVPRHAHGQIRDRHRLTE